MTDFEQVVLQSLARIEAALAPEPDNTQARIAKIERLLGDPIPGVDAADWAKVVKYGQRAVKLLKRLT
jgi:hypothetical protein